MGKFLGIVVGAALMFIPGVNVAWVAIGRGLLISTALGLVSQALSKRPSTSGSTMAAQGRLETIRQPLGPWQVIFGRCRVGGVLTYFDVTADKQTAHMIITYAGHPVRAIKDVYFNDLSTVDYGSHGAATAAAGRFAGYSNIHRSNGTEGAAQPFAALVSAGLSWGAADLQRDRAKVYTTHTFSNEVWQTGLPAESAVIEGVDEVYDPRVGSPGTSRWSNNPALCVSYYITATYGLGATYATEIDEAALIAAANVCDERVALVGTVTSTIASVSAAGNTLTLAVDQKHVDYGDGVRFTSTGTLPAEISAGTTYYAEPTWEGDTTVGQIIRLATSYDNLMAGSFIDLTTEGSGTITMTFYDEPRYRLNGAFRLSEEPGAVMERMLASMAGSAINVGGVWFIYAGAYTAPTLTFDEDDFASGLEIKTSLSRRDTANAIKGSYVEPSARFQPVDFPPVISQTYFEEDGAERVWRDLDLTAFVLSGTQAQRLAKIDLITLRTGLVFSARFKLSAYRMATGATVSITNAQMGWSAKVFLVTNCRLVFEDNGGIEVEATLKETDAAIYDWETSEEQLATLSPNTNLPDPTAIAVPTGFAFVQSTVVPERGEFSWVAPVDAFVDAYQVEWADAGSPTTWRVEPKVKGLTTIVDGLALGDFQFRIRAFNIFGAASDYVTIFGAMNTPTIADVTGLVLYGTSGSPTVTAFTGKDCTVQWEHVASGSAGYFFKDYEVSVYRAGSPTELLRTEYTSDPWYTYSFEKNYKDTGGVPVRDFRFEVKRRGFYNQTSAAVAQLSVSNSAPAVSGFTLTAGSESFQFLYTASDPDFVGMKIYSSLTSGFTPGSTNLVYEGSKKNGVVGPLVGGMKYYVKYVPADAFGDGATSSEYSVTVERPVGASLGADFGVGSLYEVAAISMNTAYSWVIASAPVYVPSTGLIYCFGAVSGTYSLELAAFDARTLELVKRVTLAADWPAFSELELNGQPVYSPDTEKIYIPIYDNSSPSSYIYEVDPTTLEKTASYSTSNYQLLRGMHCSKNSKMYWLIGLGVSKILALDVVGSPNGYTLSATTPSGSMSTKSIFYLPTVNRLVIADAQYIYFLTTDMVETGSPQERINLSFTVGSLTYCPRNDRIYATHDAGSNDIKVVSSGLGLVTTISGAAALGGITFYSPQNGALYLPKSANTGVISTETNSFQGTLSAMTTGYTAYGVGLPIVIPDMYLLCLIDTGPRLELHAI